MKKVHFIGIGGIGMSALARWYLSLGYKVTGSDRSKSENIEHLVREGVEFLEGENSDFINQELEKVIYTLAIPEGNLELAKAKEMFGDELSKKVQTYPQALGEMTKNKKVIAVCGTHGKTTTTAMAYFALKNAGVDVSMILGSLIHHDGEKTNYVHGESEWIVIEACEYRRSFLNYYPEIILLTNIDNDHLDYFEDMSDTKNAFQEFVNNLRGEKPTLITHREYADLVAPTKIVSEDVIATNQIELSVPGEHNRKNAQLVVALGDILRLEREKILTGLKSFSGTWRRQEFKGFSNHYGATFYDDYAHHPTELKATLSAFREKFPNAKIFAVFQPHLFSRTKLLLDDFGHAFADADEVLVLPIYAARENDDGSVSSQDLVDKIKSNNKDARYVENLSEVLAYLKTEDEKRNPVDTAKRVVEHVCITLGAGDIDKLYKIDSKMLQ